MTKPSIFVCGLGRCGTSLMMQMLDRGGVPTLGRWPAFECEETMLLNSPFGERWLRRHAPGHAVKLLDPQRWTPPTDLPALVIWLDRNLNAQAASQAKIAAPLSGLQPDRSMRRGFVSELRRERKKARAALGGPDRRQLKINFEDALADPLRAAMTLANFVGPDFALDPAKAASAVIPRSGDCYPGLLEERLLIKGRAA